MLVALVVSAALTVIANAGIAAADLAGADFVVANSTEVGLRPSQIPALAALKAAGALGLLVGVLGVLTGWTPAVYLGVAAAIGLVLFFTGALVAHTRARVFHNIYYPAAFWALAAASLTLLLVAPSP